MSVNIYNATQDTLTRVDGGGDLRWVEIPYSEFTWDSTNTRYTISNFTPPFNTVVDYAIVPTNGMAVMSGYYNPVTKILSVVGWIPVNAGAPISSGNEFKCFVIGTN